MDLKADNICSLCFATCTDNGYEEIDDSTQKVFDVLLIDMNLDLYKNPIICFDCAATTLRCFNFKLVCVCKEVRRLCFAIDDTATKLGINNVAKNENAVDVTNVCTFCMDSTKTDVLNIDAAEQSLVVEMLPIFLPEKDFHSIKNTKTCLLCKTELDVYVTFLFKCMKAKGNSNLQQDVEIGTCQNKISASTFHSKYKEYLEEVDKTFNCDVCPYKAKRKDNLKSHKLKHDEVKKYECERCEFRTKWSSSLKTHVWVTHSASEVKKYECPNCAYRTNLKSVLNRHMNIHRNAFEVVKYRCSRCSFETIWKTSIKAHLVTCIRKRLL